MPNLLSLHLSNGNSLSDVAVSQARGAGWRRPAIARLAQFTVVTVIDSDLSSSLLRASGLVALPTANLRPRAKLLRSISAVHSTGKGESIPLLRCGPLRFCLD